MKNVLIVYNPNSGRKQSANYKKAVIDFLLRNKCFFKTSDINNIQTINLTDFDTIIVIGGDGTVNKAAKYCICTDKILGIIPCGTANLFAEKLGIKTNLKKALSVIKKQNIRKTDVLKINDEYSMLRIGIGYDCDIICKTPQSIKNIFGYFSYFAAGILLAIRLKSKNYKLLIDNQMFNINASCVIIANAANMYKNIVSLACNSSVDDGIAEIFVLKTENPLLFFFEFLNILFKKRQSSVNAIYSKGSKIVIQNKFCTCHVDGEKMKFKDNISIEVCSAALNVFAPF